MERFTPQTGISSPTVYRRKEADRATFSPALPYFSFPPIYTSQQSWRTEGLKVSIFLLAIPARPSPEVPAVTLQWSSNTLKREWTALIQLSLKEHTDIRTRSKEIKKKSQHPHLKLPLMQSCYRTFKEKRQNGERPTGGKNVLRICEALCPVCFSKSVFLSNKHSNSWKCLHGNGTDCSKGTLLYHLLNDLGKVLVKTFILWSYIKSTI